MKHKSSKETLNWKIGKTTKGYQIDYAQQGAAADVARRGEKWFKCVSLFDVKCILEEAGPRG